MRRILVAALAFTVTCAASARVDNASNMVSIMAVATFASTNCPTMVSNKQLIADMFNTLKVNSDVMTRQPYLNELLDLLKGLESNRAYSCESIWTMFGDEGTVLKNVLMRR